MEQPTVFDVCFIAFVDIETDARTLNLAHTIARQGLKVSVIGLGTASIITDDPNDSISYYKIHINPKNKTWQKWLDFYRKSTVIAFDIRTKFIFAEDVYSLPIAKEMANNCKAKLIYDSREIYSALGPLAGKKFKQLIIKHFEKHYIHRVSDIIVTGELDKQLLEQTLSNKHKYHIIKNFPKRKPKVYSNKIREKFAIPDSTSIALYQGVIHKGRGIEKTIQAIATLRDAVLVIIGDGPYMPQIRNYINTKQLQAKVHLTGAIPYEQLHEWTCSADIGISFIEPVSKSYELALPNKLFEYIMAEIPVLCTDLPPMKDVIDTYNVGKYLPFDSPTELIASTIYFLLQNRDTFAMNCRDATPKLCFETQEQTIKELLA